MHEIIVRLKKKLFLTYIDETRRETISLETVLNDKRK